MDSIIAAKDAAITTETFTLVTNLTRTPVKSLARGWNCFDVDLAVYNSNLSQENLSMNIDLYNIEDLKVALNGTFQALTEGTIISTNKQTAVPGVIKQVAGKASEVGSIQPNRTR